MQLGSFVGKVALVRLVFEQMWGRMLHESPLAVVLLRSSKKVVGYMYGRIEELDLSLLMHWLEGIVGLQLGFQL